MMRHISLRCHGMQHILITRTYIFASLLVLVQMLGVSQDVLVKYSVYFSTPACV